MKNFKHLTAMVAFMCALLVAPAPVIAQSTATKYIAGGVAAASVLYGLFKGKSKSKKAMKNTDVAATSTSEEISYGATYQNTSDMEGVSGTQQQRNMTIVTNHPDFSVKVKRCAASGKTVIIDFIIENIGTNDVNLNLGDSESYFTSGRGWDDQGNEYLPRYKYANGTNYDMMVGPKALLAGVPTKLSVKLEGVPVDAESIAKLLLDIRCDEWGIGKDKPVTIRFIPITRQ